MSKDKNSSLFSFFMMCSWTTERERSGKKQYIHSQDRTSSSRYHSSWASAFSQKNLHAEKRPTHENTKANTKPAPVSQLFVNQFTSTLIQNCYCTGFLWPSRIQRFRKEQIKAKKSKYKNQQRNLQWFIKKYIGDATVRWFIAYEKS